MSTDELKAYLNKRLQELRVAKEQHIANANSVNGQIFEAESLLKILSAPLLIKRANAEEPLGGSPSPQPAKE